MEAQLDFEDESLNSGALTTPGGSQNSGESICRMEQMNVLGQILNPLRLGKECQTWYMVRVSGLASNTQPLREVQPQRDEVQGPPGGRDFRNSAAASAPLLPPVRDQVVRASRSRSPHSSRSSSPGPAASAEEIENEFGECGFKVSNKF